MAAAAAIAMACAGMVHGQFWKLILLEEADVSFNGCLDGPEHLYAFRIEPRKGTGADASDNNGVHLCSPYRLNGIAGAMDVVYVTIDDGRNNIFFRIDNNEGRC